MNKVGMITYPKIEEGKGRFLQAFCLYKTVEELGYTVEVLNYQPELFYKKRTAGYLAKRLLHNPRLLKGYLAKLRQNRFQKKREALFGNSAAGGYETFIRDHMVYDMEHILDRQDLSDNEQAYDAYLCGSDQIWNPFFFGLDDVYYLGFADRNKRIAYAASTGTTALSDAEVEYLNKKVRDIPWCSLREKSAKALFEETVKQNIEVVCDPTFLRSRDWWMDFAQSEEQETYILLFLFDDNKEAKKLAAYLAKKKHLKIKTIVESSADLKGPGEKAADENPEKFAGYFKNAAYVVTESFHGTVLSLIFNKPFYVFDRINDSGGLLLRIRDLLEIYGLTHRICTTKKYPAGEIDYRNVNRIMHEQRMRGMAYLEHALRDVMTECGKK